MIRWRFRYSSLSIFPSVGLCFSGFVFLAGTECDGFGDPTRSRAISRTTVAAEKRFFFRFFAISKNPPVLQNF